MKIASVIFMYYPIYGGAENHARLLARTFQRNGHEVTVITLHFGSTPAVETLDGIPVVRVPANAIGTRTLADSVGAIIAAFRQLRGLRPLDVVLVHGASFLLIPVLLFKKLYGIPVVVKTTAKAAAARATMMTASAWSWLNGFKRWLLKDVDSFVCMNEEMAADIKEFIATAQHISIPNGVDCRHWTPSKPRLEYKKSIGAAEHKTAVFVGRVGPEKGVDVLLKVWKEVVQKVPQAKLFVVGDGPSSDEMQQLASTLNISECVQFAGKKEDVREFLFAADVFLLFSPNEGMSNSLLEAMAAGVPIVCSDNPGNSAVVAHMVNGIKVEVAEISSAAEQVCRVLCDSALAGALEERARADVRERFDISVTARQYEQLFSRLTRAAN
jgi:glycosyltransferase involved in cell wall biosynthesis